MTSGAVPIAQVRPSSRWMPMLKMMVPLRAGSPFQETRNHWPRRLTYRTVTVTGRISIPGWDEDHRTHHQMRRGRRPRGARIGGDLRSRDLRDAGVGGAGDGA